MRVPDRPIEKVLEDHTPELMAIPGVEGTGQGESGGRAVIVVYVSRRTPELERVPDSIEGFAVDVRVIGDVRPLGR